MTRLWLVRAAFVMLLAAMLAHFTFHEDWAEGFGNVLFFLCLIVAAIALLHRERTPLPAGKPLAITYVTQDDLAKNSGYAHRAERIAAAMREMGHRVTIVGFATGTPVIEASVVRLPGIVGRIAALTMGLFSESDLIVIASVGALYNGWYALLLHTTGRALIYDAHDPVLETLEDLHGDSPLLKMVKPYLALLERLIDRYAVATLVAGPMEINVLRARGWKGPLFLVYNINEAALAFDEPRLETVRPGWDSATVVIYVGGLQREMRGIERQIEAVALARDRRADVRLMLVGFGDRAYFESRAADLILQNSAAIVADMPYYRLLLLLSSCDIAVSSEPIRHGMQTKMFDYIATGVQLISIDDGRDVTSTFSDLVLRYDGSIEQLADLFVRLAADGAGKDRAQRRQAGRELLRRLVPESRANLEKALSLVAAEA